MKLVIDTCNVLTGWTATAGTVLSLNQFQNYIANRNSASIQASMPAGGYVQKLFTPAIDVSAYDELVFHFQSFRKQTRDFISRAVHEYTITINDTAVFYVPTTTTFNEVVISLDGVTSITKLRIDAVTTSEDVIIFSSFMAVKDEFPLDIFDAMVSEIQELIDAETSYTVGTVTASAGAESITVLNPQWLLEGCAIKISGGGFSEIHHVRDYVDEVAYFDSLFDGPALLHDYTAATVTLYVPVYYGNKEIIIPGITLWEAVHEEKILRNKVSEEIDTATTTGFQAKREGKYEEHSILVDCEAWQRQILNEISGIVDKWDGRQSIWINNRRVFIEESTVNQIIHEDEGIDIVPKVQYTIKIQVKEELWDRTFQPKTANIVITQS